MFSRSILSLSNKASSSLMKKCSTLNSKLFRSFADDLSLNTYEKGREFEDRVYMLLKRRGHWRVKRNQIVKDKYGNRSEFDLVYGWPVRHYVECKNYSAPIKLDLVAKFKEVLRLNGINIKRGLFVTNSTYTPRTTTIGIKCIDGDTLLSLEANARRYRVKRDFWWVLLLSITGGLYYLSSSLGAPFEYFRQSFKNIRGYLDKIETKKASFSTKLASINIILHDTYYNMIEKKNQIKKNIQNKDVIKKNHIESADLKEQVIVLKNKLKNIHIEGIKESSKAYYNKYKNWLESKQYYIPVIKSYCLQFYNYLHTLFFVRLPRAFGVYIDVASDYCEKGIKKVDETLKDPETKEKIENKLGEGIYRTKLFFKKAVQSVAQLNSSLLKEEKKFKENLKDSDDDNKSNSKKD
ncbi:hypothetical protein WA158_000866 [Blastocystis sp. Blastoise]